MTCGFTLRFYIILCWIVATVTPRVYSLWPVPRSLQTGLTPLKLSPNFTIIVDIANSPQDLIDAVLRTKSYLANDKLQRLIVGRGATDQHPISGAKFLPSLKVSIIGRVPVRSIAEEVVQDISNRVESYTLIVPSDGSVASLTAPSTLGLFRGLTTFAQLWYYTGGDIYTLESPIKTSDNPAFPYRGFMLDTARNFFPVSDIKRTLDAMSSVKLNTFHWHITDSQSFPLSVLEFPELARKGAYSSNEVYTPTDVQDIVAYAGARGIDVLMEIDTPGHTAAISASHPEYIACNSASPWARFANEPPAGQLRIASPAVVNFTASLISSVAKTLPSKLFSTGGDEVNTNCYAKDNETQAELKRSGRTLEEALSAFTQGMHHSLLAMGKTPVVWEEMVLDHKVTLNKDTIVMVWISSEHAATVAAKNFRVVHAPSNYFYLDCGAGGWLGNNPTSNSWCDPFKTWSKSYIFDPLANINPSQIRLILGGEQLLWTEQSSPENLDSIVWPRAASSAEVFWTGATLPSGRRRDVASALPRLHDLRFRMVRRGIRAISLQPYWCVLRPGVCDVGA